MELADELRYLISQWREDEKNCLYGMDEHGNRIPRRDGNDCAEEIENLLGRLEKW